MKLRRNGTDSHGLEIHKKKELPPESSRQGKELTPKETFDSCAFRKQYKITCRQSWCSICHHYTTTYKEDPPDQTEEKELLDKLVSCKNECGRLRREVTNLQNQLYEWEEHMIKKAPPVPVEHTGGRHRIDSAVGPPQLSRQKKEEKKEEYLCEMEYCMHSPLNPENCKNCEMKGWKKEGGDNV